MRGYDRWHVCPWAVANEQMDFQTPPAVHQAIKAATKGKFGGNMKAAIKANKKYKRTVLKALRVVALWGRRRVFEQDRWLYILLM